MKLATYHDGSRDGQLVVVSRDLASAHFATGIATRLQQLLDDWNFLSPQLEDLSATLNGGKARHAFPFEPARCLAPLPRSYQRIDGAASLARIERLRRTRGAAEPARWADTPSLRQRSGDDLHGPRTPMPLADAAAALDCGAALAVVTGDVGRGPGAEQALEGVRLLLLANDWTLRAAPYAGVAGSAVACKPATAYAPVAVTTDELGAAWSGGRARLTIELRHGDARVARFDAAAAMNFHFGELIAALARTRPLRAGSIVGSGTLGSADAEDGCGCIADRRAAEMLAGGGARSAWLQVGDRVRVEALDADGDSVFGAIEQQVIAAG